MSKGIYLGPPVHRSQRLLRTALGGLAALLVAHALVFAWERSELEEARARLDRRNESARLAATRAWSADQRAALSLARAIASSDAPSVASPTRLLRLVEDALPEGVVLGSLTFEPAAAVPSIVFDAVAESEDAVSELERRIARAEGVTRNRMLEERRGADGTVSIRVQLEYTP